MTTTNIAMSHRVSQSQYKPSSTDAPSDRENPAEAQRPKSEHDAAKQMQKRVVAPDDPDAGPDPAVAGRDRLKGNEKRPMGPGVPSSEQA